MDHLKQWKMVSKTVWLSPNVKEMSRKSLLKLSVLQNQPSILYNINLSFMSHTGYFSFLGFGVWVLIFTRALYNG